MRIAALNKTAVKFAYPRLLEAVVETMIDCREYTTFEVSIILTNCEGWIDLRDRFSMNLSLYRTSIIAL